MSIDAYYKLRKDDRPDWNPDNIGGRSVDDPSNLAFSIESLVKAHFGPNEIPVAVVSDLKQLRFTASRFEELATNVLTAVCANIADANPVKP